jgi:putative membrane protein insertion efficiency factor
MKEVLLFLINLYKRYISPMLGDRCRYYPSCSTYFRIALERHGFFSGFALGFMRLIRCVPWCKGGIDEVPEKLYN